MNNNIGLNTFTINQFKLVIFKEIGNSRPKGAWHIKISNLKKNRYTEPERSNDFQMLISLRLFSRK